MIDKIFNTTTYQLGEPSGGGMGFLLSMLEFNKFETVNTIIENRKTLGFKAIDINNILNQLQENRTVLVLNETEISKNSLFLSGFVNDKIESDYKILSLFQFVNRQIIENFANHDLNIDLLISESCKKFYDISCNISKKELINNQLSIFI